MLKKCLLIILHSKSISKDLLSLFANHDSPPITSDESMAYHSKSNIIRTYHFKRKDMR